ncbi:unannotated protein [freshwater metagenome]|uniref:Unannotated protein n=1 Tax=freshwater metagenome TaxID=449393 RepID=A0A6J7D0G0_9ZZZZ
MAAQPQQAHLPVGDAQFEMLNALAPRENRLLLSGGRGSDREDIPTAIAQDHARVERAGGGANDLGEPGT